MLHKKFDYVAIQVILYSVNKQFYFMFDSISANTAIYQSAPALVFLMSIPMLKERVTLTKILSVAVTVVGVCLVSLYPYKIHLLKRIKVQSV